MKKKPEIIKLLLIVCVTYMAAAMIILPSKTMGAAETALLLCGNAVIPSLFPFIFCANIFISLGAAELAGRYLSGAMRPLFGVSGAGYSRNSKRIPRGCSVCLRFIFRWRMYKNRGRTASGLL